MIHNYEYQEFKQNILNKKNEPFLIANQELGADFFKKFHLEYSQSKMFVFENLCYICFTSQAKDNLQRLIERQKAAREAALKNINFFLDELNK